MQSHPGWIGPQAVKTPEPLTVESVTFTTPHDNSFTLPITEFVVPPRVAEHVLEQVNFDLLI
jgi:hypothetical protein